MCLKTLNNYDIPMTDATYNIYGDNAYFAMDGYTRIMDICDFLESENQINDPNIYYYIPPQVKITPQPTAKPTGKPTGKPTAKPTVKPTAKPTAKPTGKPTGKPTAKPTVKPTAKPTAKPTG
eukprot:397565_1